MCRKRVVVIGGGITGLTTAYRLAQAAQARGLPLEVIGIKRWPGNSSPPIAVGIME